MLSNIKKILTLRDLELLSNNKSNTEIHGIAVDSKSVIKGYLFVALQGSNAHGAEYFKEAIENGANAVLTDENGYEIIHKTGSANSLPIIVSKEPRLILSSLAKKLWEGQPRVMAAVTGTNGKTSVAYFTRQIWSFLEFKAVSIGTVGVEGDYIDNVKHTTPEPITLHRLLNSLSENKISHCVMEASSHGLTQCRLDSVELKAAAFTNFSHDHLDYHGNFKEYFDAKMGLFERVLEKTGTAVIYSDDKKSNEVKLRCEKEGIKTFTVGKSEENDLVILKIKTDETGQTIRYKFKESVYQTRLGLVGTFQSKNVLLALGLVLVCGAEITDVSGFLPNLSSVPGRMQNAGQRINGAPVFVDYAHTPEALKTALTSLRPHVLGKLNVVFGAGGDRDKQKRKLMGKIASIYADITYVTDDNPRKENPEKIRKSILKGCPNGLEIGDRAEAILLSIAELKSGDALLIAGKGHEVFQIIGETKFPFNDVEQASIAIQALDKRVV